MPECRICHSPFSEGQAFCRYCGANQLDQNLGPRFCPACGAKVPANQKNCPDCQASLKTEGAEEKSLAAPKQRSPKSPSSGPFLLGFLAGCSFLILLISAWSYTRGGLIPWHIYNEMPKPTETKVQPEQKETAELPKSSAASLKAELETLLATLKEANEKKDLPQFVSVYSPAFPQLPQKSQDIKKIWAIYDYPDMKFKIETVEALPPDGAFAKVIWDMETENRRTKQKKTISKAYLVWFTKESGQWRIRALEKAK
jgi:ketosteroid isomerase-like protein/RNA polymerase subunit RPABC4/transcription elongation factor Spt4